VATVLAAASALVLSSPASATGDAITVSPGSLSASQTVGTSSQQTLTLSNPTDQDAQVQLDEASAIGASGATRVAGPSGKASPVTAAHTVRTAVTPHRLTTAKKDKPNTSVKAVATDDWQTLATYPTAVMDNSVATYQGQVYSVAGTDGTKMFSSAARYDVASNTWKPIADMPDMREKPSAAFIGDKLYVTGGWDSAGYADTATWSYDPATDQWSTLADNTTPYAGAGTAVLDGKLYQVGGCDAACGSTDVRVYDPGTNAWSSVTAYPQSVSWPSCGAISGKLYCAGGISDADGASVAAYLYDPGKGSWAQVADMPDPLWASAYTASAGQLVVSGGSNATGVTNAGYVYDAASGSWSSLPAAPKPLYRAGSGCGLYTVGGSTGSFNAVPDVSSLPGYGNCAADVPWLKVSQSKVDVPAHGAASVTVTFDASKIAQPGRFTAALDVASDLPGTTPAIPVKLTVNAPASWGQLTGTVIGRSCNGVPTSLKDATVEVDWGDGGVPLRTDSSGDFSYWLDSAKSPFTVLVSKDGWRTTLRTASLTPGGNQFMPIELSPYPNCSTK